MSVFRGVSEKDERERNMCLVMLITGTLQNVRALRVIKKAANKDSCTAFTLMKARARKGGKLNPKDQHKE